MTTTNLRDDYRRWVTNALKALGPATPAQVYAWIRANEPVPPADLTTRTADDKDSVFEKTVRWARKDLYDAGIVLAPEWGVWALR